MRADVTIVKVFVTLVKKNLIVIVKGFVSIVRKERCVAQECLVYDEFQ